MISPGGVDQASYSYFTIKYFREGLIQFFKDRLEGNLILKETKEVLFPDFYEEKVCVSRMCYDYICLKNTRKWVHG